MAVVGWVKPFWYKRYSKNTIFKFTGTKSFEVKAQLNNFYKELVRRTTRTKYIESPTNLFAAFYLLANLSKK